MANRYWVGGTGNWTTTTTNWSATSGGASGASVPTAADSVFFDGNSNTGTGAFTVTVTSAANCLDLNISNTVLGTALDGVMSLAGTFNINIAGSLYTPPSPSTNFNRGSYTGVMTFTSTTTGRTITGSGGNGGQAFTFSGIGGGWTLQDTLFGGAIVLTAGTLSLGANILYASSFTSSNSNTRSINFGTGAINVSGFTWNTATVTGFSYTGIPTVNMTNSSATATTVTTGPMTAAQALNFNFTNGTYPLTLTTGNVYNNLNFTGFNGTWAAAATTHTIYGSLVIPATGGTFSATAGTSTISFANTSGISTIVTNGRTIPFGIARTGAGGTTQFVDNFTQLSTQSFTLTNGTIDINSKTTSIGIFTITTGTHAITNGTVNCASVTHTSGDLSIGTGYLINCNGIYTFTAGTITINNSVTLTTVAFSSSGTGVRSIAFGTGSITLIGSGTVWNTATVTSFSYTGTSTVNVTNNSATATTITSGAMTAAQALNFNVNAGTYELTITGSFNDLSFVGFGGTIVSALSVTVYGNLTYGATTNTIATGVITLASTTVATKTITTNGCIIRHDITVNGVGGTYTLQDAFTGTNTITLSNGTLALGTYSLTAGTFISNTATARTLNIGTNTGITLVGNAKTVWDTSTTTNLTFTTLPTVSLTYSGSTGTRTINSGSTLTGGTAIQFSITAGSDTIAFTANNTVRNLNFTGFNGTWANVAINISGNLTLSPTMLIAAGNNTLTFAFSVGTRTITSNGKALDFPINLLGLSGTGGIVQFADTFLHGATKAFTITNGTLDINSQANNIGILTIVTGTHAITNGTLNCVSVTHTSGDLSIGTGYLINCNGIYTFTAGTITINNGVALAAGAFSSSGTGVRSIAFGTGQITLTGNGTIWNTGNPANFSYTGTSTVNISNNSATATTIVTGAMTTAQALNFNITTGTYTLTMNTGNVFNSLSFVGFNGFVPLGNAAVIIYGNLTYSSTMTTSTTGGVMTLSGTSAKTLTSNGITVNHYITVNSSGGSVTLQDSFTCSYTFILTAGTLALGVYTLTTGLFNTNNSNTRSIAFGTGQINLTGNATTIWDSTTVTNFTYSGTSKINATYSGATGTRTIYPGPLTETNALNFNITAGSDTINIYGNFKNIDLTGFGGIFTLISATTLYGNLTIPATVSTTATTAIMTFSGTAAIAVTQILDTNGVFMRWPIVMSGTAGVKLNSTLNQLSTQSFTLTTGTLDMNSQTTNLGIFTILTGTHSIANGTVNCASVTHTSGDLSIGTGYLVNSAGTYIFTAGTININNGVTLTANIFNTNSSSTRSIAFGTGQINLTGNATAIWDSTTVTGFTYSGTSKINLIYSGATGTRTIYPGTLTETNALNFNITAGSDLINIYGNFKNIDFTGFSGVIGLVSATILYGNLTIPATATTTTSTLSYAMTFSGTIAIAVTQILNTNGVVIQWPMVKSGTAGLQTISALSQSPSLSFTLINGILDMNSQTTNLGIFTIQSGTHAITNGTLNCASVTHASGDLSIGTGYLINCIGTYTFTAGTITINNGVTLSAGTFSSSGTSVRSIAFGTGNLTLNGAISNITWDTSNPTSFSYTGTSTVNIAYNSANPTGIATGAMSTAQALNFNIITGTYALTLYNGSVFNNLNFVGFNGSVPLVNANITVYGNLTYTSTMTSSTTGGIITLAGASVKNITANGSIVGHNITVNNSGVGSVTLQDAFTCSSTFTLTAGILSLGNYSLTTRIFNTNSSSTRSIVFGTGQINLTGNATTIWDSTTVTGFTYSGTSKINATYSGATGTRTIYPGPLTETNALNFNITAGSDIINIYGNFKNIDLTGFGGIFTLISATILYGNLTIPATVSTTATTAIMTLGGTTAIAVTQILDTNGVFMRWPITMAGTAGVRLNSTLNQLSTQSFTFTTGTLDMNSQTTNLGIFTILTGTHAITNGTVNCASVTHTSGDLSIGTGYLINSAGIYTFTAGTITILNGVTLTTGSFNTNSSSTRSIAFGTGQINLIGNATAIWDSTTVTGFTYSGTSKINATYSGATGTRTIYPGPLTETNALNFNITSGSDIINIYGNFKNIDFTGFIGTFTLISATTLYGNLTIPATATTSSSVSIMTLGGTTAIAVTQIINTNGVIIRWPISISATAVVQLSSALTQLATQTFTLTTTTLDINSQIINVGPLTITTGNSTITNGILRCPSVSHASGNIFVGTGTITTTGTYTFTSGVINITNSATLTAAAFSSANSNTRSIAFGTGNITLTGTGTVWDTNIVTSFSYTGTSAVNIANNTATSSTVSTGIPTAAQALNFNFIAGTYALTLVSGMVFKNLNFTGFSGTYAQAATTITVYGDLTFSSSMTSTSTTGSLTVSGTTSPTYINGNGHTVGCNIIITKTSSNAQVWLGSAFTSTLANGFSFTSGVFDTKNYNLTLNTFSSLGSLARLLTLGSSQVTITGSGTTAWNTDPAVSVFANTATISMTSASAKTFVGSGKTWYKLNQGGTGDLSITGNNTFNDISNTVQPSIIYFPSGGTTTVSNFSLKGTYGKLTSITSTTSTHTLTKTSGIVSVNYCNISKSIATGGASWRAYTSEGNVNGGTNTGWSFTNPNNPSNFFSFFL